MADWQISDTHVPWIVAIGASGKQGLHDIAELLGVLPLSLPAIILVVLHRPWNRRSFLQDVLAQACRFPVVIAAHGERLVAGTVYIGEAAEHLTLAVNRLAEMIADPYRHHGNRTVDLLSKSVAACAGTQMIGVVLSGALDDGSRGLAAIHAAGGTTMELTPATPPQPGVPENAISFNGPIDLIGNLGQIGDGIYSACNAERS